MPRTATRFRAGLAGAVAIAALAAVPAAQAYEGDWTIAGEFERTTTPSFAGGFNPNDIDAVSASFDNRAKRVSLDLRYFDVPGRGNVYVAFGTGRADGTCDTGTMDIAIDPRDVTRTREVTETTRVWVERFDYRYTWSRYDAPEGEGWEYVGRFWTRSSWQHRWERDGHWQNQTVTRTITEVDPDAYERVGTLELDGVDGSLESVTRLATDATEMSWSFGSPLLSGVQADCLEITVPGRRAPFTIAPPAAPAPPAGDPDAALATADEVALDDIEVTATRRAGRIVLTLTGGEADRVQVRVNGRSKTVAFKERVVLRTRAASARSVMVRFDDAGSWSDWERVALR
jgi:hypothetical protein